MIDLTQLLLLLVILILTTLLVVVGIEVFFLLRALRKTLNKIDKVVIDASEMTNKLKTSITSISEFKLSLSTLAKIVSFFQRKKEKNDEREES